MSERTRTFTWDDPMVGAQAAFTMSGLEYIQAMRDGKVPPPPIAMLMGMGVSEVSEGRVIFTCVPHEWHYNPIGVVHGGLAATLLDSAMGCCVQTMLPTGVGYTTLELSVNYIRPMTITTGEVSAIAEIIHSGRQTATAQSRIVDRAGKLYAHGSTTCIILRP